MDAKVNKGWKTHKRIKFDKFISPIMLLGLMAFVAIINPAFLRIDNLLGILEQSASRGVIALGAMFVLITGGIDLTAGNGLAMIAVFAGVTYSAMQERFLALFVISLMAGAALGIINGVLITRFNLMPFVATLAMLSITQGLTLLVSEGQIIFLKDPISNMIGNGRLFGFLPTSFAVFFVMCVIAWMLLKRTRWGTSVYALGGNEEAAAYSGINTKRNKLKVYVYAGICTGIGALLTVCRVAQVAANLSGSVMMDAISAAVIGGTSVSGGKGEVSGAFFGVLIISVISNAMTFLRVPVIAQDVVKGFIILFAIIFDAIMQKRNTASVHMAR